MVASSNGQPEAVTLRLARCFGGLEQLEATFRTHRFDWHCHDEYVIAMVDKGAEAFRCRGEEHVAPAGAIFTLNPGEPHDGRGADERGWTYRVIYPSIAVLERALDTKGNPPMFRQIVWASANSFRLLSAFHNLLQRPDCALLVESAFVAAMTELARSNGSYKPPDVLADSGKLRDVYAIINERYSERLSLDALGCEVSLHPNYLIAAFRRRYGLTPSRALCLRRLAASKDLMRRGITLSDVALKVGFFDQSHFTRYFKRAYGITPSQYRSIHLNAHRLANS